MSRWGELIPHREDDESCLCGCQDDDGQEMGSDGMEAWLQEVLDAAERIARAACWDAQSDVWTARPPQASYERYTVVDYLDDGVVAVTPENADDDGVGQHIALNDPAAVLRRIAADRKLLGDLLAEPHAVLTPGGSTQIYCDADSGPGEPCNCGRDERVDRYVQLLAEGWGWTEETAT